MHALLDEPLVRQRVARADLAEPGCVGNLAAEADDRMGEGERVREGGIVDHLDARDVAIDEKQRGAELGSIGGERAQVDDEEVGLVAARREPLVGVDQPAIAAALRRARDTARVRAGVLLGDAVALDALAAQRGPQVSIDLLGRAVCEHVRAGRDIPPDAVRVAAVGLV